MDIRMVFLSFTFYLIVCAFLGRTGGGEKRAEMVCICTDFPARFFCLSNWIKVIKLTLVMKW